MAYRQRITEAHPAYLLLVVDRSAGMAEASKAMHAAELVNRSLLALAQLCVGSSGVSACFEVSLLLYDGIAPVTSGFQGTLGGRWSVSARDLAFHPLRVEKRRRRETDGKDGSVEVERDFPIWLEPGAAGTASLSAALEMAERLARDWAERHADCFPPVVLTISGGMPEDGDPTPRYRALERLATRGGKALLFNCVIGRPPEATEAADSCGQQLFQLSRELPPATPLLPRGADGKLLDSDPARLVEALFATRVDADAPASAGGGWLARFFASGFARGLARPQPAVPAEPAFETASATTEPAGEPATPLRRAASAAFPPGRFALSSFVLQKEGAPARQCDDAVAFDRRSGRFAVADGATEGRLSRSWARLLAFGWSRGAGAGACSAEADAEALQASIGALDGALRRRATALEARRRAGKGLRVLPYDVPRSTGSYAAFLGLELDPSGAWRALALGDCCLFVERGDTCLSFPIVEPEGFSSRVRLVPSALEPETLGFVERSGGRFAAGDRFLLMSDAIACWYMANADRRADLRALLRARDRGGLARLVAEERRSQRLRDDDVAILLVQVAEAT